VKLRYRRLCEKKREEVVRWEKEVKEAKTEGQVWKIVNKERKSRKRVNEGIEMEEWEIYFKGLLGGVEWRVVSGAGGKFREDEEEEIGRDEFRRVIRKLKDRKALGGDGIPNEVWKRWGGSRGMDFRFM